ncbi:MAG: LPS export ABC transporter periplasmic protein LptC [Chitinophagaceae bacterium]|nr:MAG: LPS export ABC transporter periplasmic protein LptC [Chitinophagaceae bacterium]
MSNHRGYKYFNAAAFLIGCCFVCGCENSQADIDRLTKKVAEREEAIDVSTLMSTAGQMKANLKAPLMYRVLHTEDRANDTMYVEFPKSLHVDFYNDSTRIETKLDAKYGKYYETLNKVYLRDSVVIMTIQGDTLRCHDMWWDQNRGLFYTDTVATYVGPGNNIRGGKGMEATQDLKTVTFKQPLGNMQVKANGFAE